MKIELRDIGKIKPYARNPRLNDQAVDAVAASLKEFGFRQPVVVDRRGVIIAGHTRYKAAVKLGLKQVPVHVASDLTAEQVKAYRLADNRTADFAEWDFGKLTAELDGIGDEMKAALAALDFDGLLAEAPVEPQAGLTDPDAVPDPPAEPITKRGDLWLLGGHRLLCGDSTKAENRNRVGFADCGAVVYDPPWNTHIPDLPLPPVRLVFGDGQRIADMMSRFGLPTWLFGWDCVTSWYCPSRPLRRMKLCAWYGNLDDYDPDAAHYGEAGEEHTGTNTRGPYRYVPDSRGKHLADLFVRPITVEHDGSSHGKPVDWIRLLVGNCTRGIVADPFCGTGTAVIAAEQLGRRCYGMEIEPRYVDVAVKRWEEFTGKKAILENRNA